MEEMLREYLPILVFLAVAVALGLVLILAAVVLAVRRPDPEKVSAYECGFNAFDDARMKFDVRFYLVSSCSSFSISKLRCCSRGPSGSRILAWSGSGR